VTPDAILDDLLARDGDLALVPYYGERAVFYNPGAAAPLGVIVAAIKEQDGPNDRSARLSRPGVFRFALGLRAPTFERLFGPHPARPPKGGVVAVPGYDHARLDALMPHPVYAWMSWVQILSPSRARFDELRPLVDEALDFGREKWGRRSGHHVRDAAER
jgi:hypothetical protein